MNEVCCDNFTKYIGIRANHTCDVPTDPHLEAIKWLHNVGRYPPLI